MVINKTHIILFVESQELSTLFYENLFFKKPDLNVRGMTEFHINDQLVVGLMPISGIEKIVQNKLSSPSLAKDVAKCELYLMVDDFQKEYERLLNLNIQLISPAQNRDWGHRVAYFSDLDSNLIAIACEITV